MNLLQSFPVSEQSDQKSIFRAIWQMKTIYDTKRVQFNGLSSNWTSPNCFLGRDVEIK